jgi:signal transduction histidine kinase
VLRVVDTGTGMDAEVLQRVFEPFFTTKHGDRGTGLGLASVEGAVTQLGGTIHVESRPGQGTKFEVVLPNR